MNFYLKDYLKPIKYSMLYLIMTIIFLMISPMNWRINNSKVLILYLLINFSSFFIGYYVYVLKNKEKNNVKQKIQYTILIKKIYIFSVYYTILYNSYRAIFNFKNLGLNSLLDILNPGSLYMHKLNIGSEFSSGFLSILNLFWVLSYFYLPILFIYWGEMKKKERVNGIIALILTIGVYLIMGTLKGIGDIVIILIPCYITRKIMVKKRKNPKKTLLFILIATIFISYFGFVQVSRNKSLNIDNSEMYKKNVYWYFAEYEEDNVFTKVLGENLGYSAITLMNYVSHGYVGLSYCLELPFEPTYGIGHSRAMMEYGEQYFGIYGVKDKIYTARNEKISGWPNGMLWSSIFPWIASDISFSFTFIFMFILGCFFAKCWCEFIERNNVLSLIMVSQIFILIFYIPANNQLFQSRTAMIGSIELLGIYFISKLFTKRIKRREIY